MRRARRLAFLGMLAVAFSATAASAAPRIEFQSSQKEVAVGELFQVTLSVLDDVQLDHGNPKLRLPDSIVVRGQMMGPLSYTTNFNGTVTRLQGLNATFTLEAKKKGTFTIGPLTIVWGGKTLTSKALSITVGAERKPSNPWGQLRSFFDDDDPRPPAEEETDPKLSLPAALGSHAFLHATIDKETAVLGEQRTLSVYLYQDADLPSPEVLSASEPALEGFLSKSLLPSGQEPPELGKAKIGERRYRVRLVRKQAIFPVQAGPLKIGPMRLKIRARGNGDRASESFTVVVTEPPKLGRPGNYVLGTTGSYRADCSVDPRTTKDGIVGVTVKLDGYGLFPDRLPVPNSQNVTFEAPELRDNFVADEGGRWGGWRSFQYVAKLASKGTTDLGELSLPFYNPSTAHYESAKCTLGTVVVENASPPPAPIALSPLLLELPKAETHLAGAPESTTTVPRKLLWAASLGPLALVGLALVKALPKRKKRVASPEQVFRNAIKVATIAASERRSKDAIGEIERGIESFVKEKSGASLRADEAAKVRELLGERDVADETIEALLQLRAACTQARYGTTDDVDVTPLLESARLVSKRLS